MFNTIKGVPKAGTGSPLLRGLLTSGIWLAGGAVLLSLLLRFGGLDEDSLAGASWAVHGAAAFAGGYAAGKKAAKRGWLTGATLGVLYGVIVMLVGFLAADASLTLHSGSVTAAAAGAGAVGGMLGVGLAK